MTQGTNQLLFGTTLGKTFAFDDNTFSDNGAAISLKVRTKEYYPSPIEKEKEIQEIYVFSDDPHGTNLSISLDGGDYEYKGQIQGEKSRGKQERFMIWKSGIHFSLALDEISTNNIKIKGFTIFYV